MQLGRVSVGRVVGRAGAEINGSGSGWQTTIRGWRSNSDLDCKARAGLSVTIRYDDAKRSEATKGVGPGQETELLVFVDRESAKLTN